MFSAKWRMFVAYYWQLIIVGVVLCSIVVVSWLMCGCHIHLHLRDSHYYGEEGERITVLEIQDNELVER